MESYNPIYQYQRHRTEPYSGSILRSDNIIYNKADFELPAHLAGGNASILSLRMTGLAGDGVDHYFVINIPLTKKWYLNERILNLTSGEYNVDAIEVDSIDLTGATTGEKGPLDKVNGTSVETNLVYTSNTPVNPVIREYGFVDTGSTQGGQSRPAGSSGTENVIKILTGPSILRITKLNSGTFTCNLVYSCWETDI